MASKLLTTFSVFHINSIKNIILFNFYSSTVRLVMFKSLECTFKIKKIEKEKKNLSNADLAVSKSLTNKKKR